MKERLLTNLTLRAFGLWMFVSPGSASRWFRRSQRLRAANRLHLIADDPGYWDIDDLFAECDRLSSLDEAA